MNNVFLDHTLRSNYAMASRGVDSISVSESSSVEDTVYIICLNLKVEFVVVYCCTLYFRYFQVHMHDFVSNSVSP